MNKLVEIAMGEYGTEEVVGAIHNPEVIKYFHESGHKYINDDETPWCSAFMGWVTVKAKFERSAKLNARSWLGIGREIQPEDAEPGDIVIFYRGDKHGWQGHVAMYIAQNKNYFHVLGGNQSNSVCIAKYSKKRLLGIRRLKSISDMSHGIV